ncbi:hypothetical protein LCGC14_0531590 [marine sediment metagenome]|uniref:Uncharacterized protein n=1 Tax=marine sediment metagenome TaxID=412755 RepID=A0A0F9V3P1_9ZZZZ
MMEYLEEALDFYLGEKEMGSVVDVNKPRKSCSTVINSKPELKLWEVEP